MDFRVNENGNGFVLCENCQTKHPITSGYIDTLSEKPAKDTLAQRIMKWNPIVNIYEGKLWRNSFWAASLFGINLDAEMDMISHVHSLSHDALFLDLACGPGLYARMFAKKATDGFVVGLDYSPQMLTKAVSLAKRDNLKNITFIRGDAHNLSFGDGCFGGVNCTGAFHLFHDPGKVLDEIYRITKTGAKLTIGCGRRLARGNTRYSERLLSINTFSPDGVSGLLLEHGFTPQLHYTGKYWIVLSGTRID
ncbi:MAG TPA: class I SAM-dependent methyltransferase [Caldisericia bacterium]|nr:class I SAM-dependent methyltransferase [Caldisericia bacterium]HPF49783.1 class I SAM-dependent methyltransferase [Caldisericia bacterium]HPI84344.1 class I SAM-dependent methyltransferase [Caldisericia bacterium]HPQ93771.1 class I SAM-dependent methyltransferase [Caldisericia bacterium]HRV74805.1 class I SAM-dependent methyltransferase [Caldisericia bacterium]